MMVFSIAGGCKKWIIKPASIFLLSFLAAVVTNQLAFYIVSAIFLTLTTFFIIFFRDPERKIPSSQKLIVSPADGTVIKIDRVGKYSRIAIFMNRHNVHVNRAPVSGKVLEIKRFSGPKKLAYKDYAEKNERLATKFKTAIGDILVVQITGVVARRIESYLKIGQFVKKGERIGIIKLGSRCDLYLPKNKVNILTKMGDSVYAGESVVARKIA